ncbi:hypothetical protein, variant [Verruconis gallopava]|uniref:White collar 1 protein n=1 Tax=Verruconis gallopava TaxID=253628 RepID=A0A0D1YJ14_9PEZI|nr:hypothetical protein, variant [Verruconis gallopava]KIW00867.1 hypothetical protein, variant [Verruconis gallopava]
MNGYYQRRYTADDAAQQYAVTLNEPDAQHMMDMAGMGSNIPAAQSLDEIVNQNAKEMRRRSMPVGTYQNPAANEIDDSMRRASMVDMMDFSAGSPDMAHFNFDHSGFDSAMVDMSPQDDDAASRQRSNGHANSLSVNARFATSQPDGFGSMSQHSHGFDSAMAGARPLDMDMTSPYLTSAFPTSMPMSNEMNMMSPEMPQANTFNPEQYNSPMVQSPIHPAYASSMLAPSLQDPGGGTAPGATRRASHSSNNAIPDPRQSTSRTSSNNDSSSQSTSQQGSVSTQPTNNLQQSVASAFSPKRMAQNPPGPPEMVNGNPLPWTAPPDGWPSSQRGRTHMDTQFKDAYAPSGYDLMSILIRVANRPKPQINIGAVDLSCAFVVCNTKAHDAPIEYASESFERLTGYSKHEIIGQNCRFLQSPDGRVTPGVKRKYCDDDAVLYLKNCINTRTEAQISLINYRKGGQPFMNLLTMIPLMDDNGETSHFVGFQVDLVENPTAINARNPDGTYSINYQRHESLPSYFLAPPGEGLSAEISQTLPRDEVSTVLGTITGAGENELSRRLMDKVLLENADDVIHVLSLKGLFLYLSPSCRNVLEYDPSELVGTPLSSVCHPSDIVPVTRELKDPSSGPSLSVVFRIRRKNSGYMWFESHGSLHTEQGKGRKCIILVGRERPVYTLNKSVLMEGGGIGENELWAKMSTTGMFLFVSSNVRQLLDRQPEELVGTNIQALMRPDSKEEFGRVLTIALTGKNTSVRHEVTNKRGQVLQAFSWIYPGDATEGNKPTFLVVQTRLIRYHSGGGNRQSVKGDQGPRGDALTRTSSLVTAGNATPYTNHSSSAQTVDTSMYRSAEGYAVTHAGQAGLAIGRQDMSLASEDNMFDELKTVRSSSWQFELRQMEKRNRMLAEEVQSLIAAKKKRKRRRGAGSLQKDCANCHTKNTPEWRRGPSGQRDLCNSCGLRWAKQV